MIIRVSMFYLFISTASAFVAAPALRLNSLQELPIILNLHPDQAPDLEACAYDFLKEAVAKKLEEEYRAAEASSRPRRGPIAWCKRVWSRTSTSGETPRTSSSLHQQKP
jgi:hypothetical protein